MKGIRGHTNNRILAAALASLYLRAKEESVHRSGDDFFDGRADGAREIAVLMGLDEQFDEILERANK